MVHGDAHVGNLLRRPDHRVVLCDFDSTCLGPAGVDLAAVAAAEIWFPSSGEHERLAASYGLDITTDPAWPVLRQARELTFVVGGVPLLASTPGVAAVPTPPRLGADERHHRDLDPLRRIRQDRLILIHHLTWAPISKAPKALACTSDK